ncbi:MAG TPA: GDSL-type esterase/lipase family protein [Steroidobacteraceae bacterium]|jgi:lysophospholipase L1-like esterase
MRSPDRRIRLLLVIVAAIGVASLALNVVLIERLSSSFAELQFSRVFPLGYVPREESAKPSGDAAGALALYGDSRALLWRPRGMQVVNFAHGGQTSTQLRLQLESQPAVRTRWSLVQIGINDLHPLGALAEDRALIVATLRDNVAAIVRTLAQRSDCVIVSTIFPPAHVPLSRRPFWDEATPQYVADVNRSIAALADGRRVLVLDAHAVLRGADGYIDPKFIDPDFFLHVNATAYAALDASLSELLHSGAVAPPENK